MTTRPPGRATRSISAPRSPGCATCSMTLLDITTSATAVRERELLAARLQPHGPAHRRAGRDVGVDGDVPGTLRGEDPGKGRLAGADVETVREASGSCRPMSSTVSWARSV